MNYRLFLVLFITSELTAIGIEKYVELVKKYDRHPTDELRKQLVSEYNTYKTTNLAFKKLADTALDTILTTNISKLEAQIVPPAAAAPAPATPAAVPTRALPAGAPATEAALTHLRSEVDAARKELAQTQSELERSRTSAREGQEFLTKELNACRRETELLKASASGEKREVLIEELKKSQREEMDRKLNDLRNELAKSKKEIEALKAGSSTRSGLAGVAGAVLGAGAAVAAGTSEAELRACQKQLAQSNAELKQSDDQRKTLAVEIEAIRKQAAEQQKHYEDELQKRQTANKELEDKNKVIALYKEKSAELSKKIAELKEHFATELKAREQRMKGQAESAVGSAELEKLKTDLKTSLDEKAQLEVRLSQAQKDCELRSFKTRTEEQIAEYTAATKELKDEYDTNSAKLRTESNPALLFEFSMKNQAIKNRLLKDISSLRRSLEESKLSSGLKNTYTKQTESLLATLNLINLEQFIKRAQESSLIPREREEAYAKRIAAIQDELKAVRAESERQTKELHAQLEKTNKELEARSGQSAKGARLQDEIEEQKKRALSMLRDTLNDVNSLPAGSTLSKDVLKGVSDKLDARIKLFLSH